LLVKNFDGLAPGVDQKGGIPGFLKEQLNDLKHSRLVINNQDETIILVWIHSRYGALSVCGQC